MSTDQGPGESPASWRVRGLTAGYGQRQILRPLDLDIPFGRATLVVGPGGSGKTTLLRALAGSPRPGEMWVQGRVEPPPERALLVPQGRGAVAPDDLFAMLDHIDDDGESVVLLDEPFVHLPTQQHEELHRRLDQLRLTHTLICVTHNLRHSRRLADHMVLLVDGELIESASADDFFERPQHPRTADFLVTGS